MFNEGFHSKRELKDLILAKEICFIRNQNLLSMFNVRDMMNMTAFFIKFVLVQWESRMSTQNPFWIHTVLISFCHKNTLFLGLIKKRLEKLF